MKRDRERIMKSKEKKSREGRRADRERNAKRKGERREETCRRKATRWPGWVLIHDMEVLGGECQVACASPACRGLLRPHRSASGRCERERNGKRNTMRLEEAAGRRRRSVSGSEWYGTIDETRRGFQTRPQADFDQPASNFLHPMLLEHATTPRRRFRPLAEGRFYSRSFFRGDSCSFDGNFCTLNLVLCSF